MVGSDFVTDTATSLDAFINASADELYDLLTLKFQDYNLSSSSLTTVSGTGTYALPSDFYKLMGVDITYNGRTYGLDEFSFRERHRYEPGDVNLPDLPKYRLEGTNLRLRPTPTGVYSGTVWYTPTRTQLVSGSDTLTGVSGWEEYVVVDAAIKCLLKEESDPSALMAKKAELKQRIEEAASVRSPAAPSRVVDVEGLNDW
jgi:hypothetical protein